MLASSSRAALKRVTRVAPSCNACRTGQAEISCGPTFRRHASAATATSSTPHNRTPRNHTWNFTPDPSFKGSHSGTPLARYNLDLAHQADVGHIPECFRICMTMKQQNVKPDRITYSHLMRCLAEKGLVHECWATLEDMLAMGLTPDRVIMHHLLHSERFSESTRIPEILRLMQDEFQVKADARTYELLVLRSAATGNLELALQHFHTCKERGLSPTLPAAQAVIELATKLGHPRLALEVAESFERESVRRLDNSIWSMCLRSAAEQCWMEGVRRCWQKVVKELNLLPDEGLCIAVANTAAQHGASSLIGDVLEVLGKEDVTLAEHHFAPLIQAFAQEGKIEEAFDTLSYMRQMGISPERATTRPLRNAIAVDFDKLEAAWDAVGIIHAQSRTVDVAVFNTILQASLVLKDLPRAFGVYQSAAEYGIAPDVDSYNILLDGAITARRRAIGDQLLQEMRQAGVQPDRRTYEKMTLLCLRDEESYEDAFVYLEEMKSMGHLPTYLIYDSIVRKCIESGDERWTLALEELKECGYKVNEKTQALIDSGGRQNLDPTKGGAADTPETSLDTSRELFTNDAEPLAAATP